MPAMTLDGAAIERLYRSHGHVVLRRARLLLGNEADAQEALQEVFAALLRAPQDLRSAGLPFGAAPRSVSRRRVGRAGRAAAPPAPPRLFPVRGRRGGDAGGSRRAVAAAARRAARARRAPLLPRSGGRSGSRRRRLVAA